MIILPAIDLLGRKAVRLLKGDYNQVTVYSDSPLEVAEKFKSLGATHIHMVDLDGAKYGTAPNMDIVAEVAEKSGYGDYRVFSKVFKKSEGITPSQYRRDFLET